MVKSYAIKEVSELTEKVIYSPGFKTKSQAEDSLRFISKDKDCTYTIVYIKEFIRRREKEEGIENELQIKEIQEPKEPAS